MKDIQMPVNNAERMQYESLIRLDALCNMVSSLVEHISNKEGIAVTQETTQIVEEVVEVKKDEPKKNVRKNTKQHE